MPLSPAQVILSGIAMPVVQSIFYMGAKLLIRRRKKYGVPGALDRRIPFIPAAALPYLSSYLFWVVSYVALYAAAPGRYMLTLAAQTVGSALCFAVYVAVPTEMKPPEAPEGFLGGCVRLIRWLDNPLVNLFPSMHCMASWLCLFGAWGVMPLWWQGVSLVWTLAICWSTVTVKQHYLPDTTAGLAVAVISWVVCVRWPWPAQALATLLAGLGL